MQCCVSSRCIAQWFSYTYALYICSLYIYSVIYRCIPILFWICFPYRLLQNIESRVPWIIFFLLFYVLPLDIQGFPGGSNSKESTCYAGDLGSIPGLGRYPREGNHYPLQYSGLGNSMDRGTWQATVHGVTKSWTQLSIQHLVYLWYTRFCLAIYTFPSLISILVYLLIWCFRKWWVTKDGWVEVWQSGCEQRKRDSWHCFVEILLQISGVVEM